MCYDRVKMGEYWKISTFIFAFLVLCLNVFVESGPLTLDGPSREVANNSLAEFDSATSKGCRYKAVFYSNGEEVSTDEPCLACQCKGTVVVCKLRICPEIPVPPPPGCIVVHKAKSCCSQLICHGQGQEIAKKISREQRFPLSVSNETLLASVSNESKDSGFCLLDGTVYAEGSAMRSSTLCQYCFCIRGEMKCSSPQCVIPLKGCKPRFRSYACCPTNYDCGQSNETAILQTMPSSTQVPQFLKGCLVGGQFVPEGEPVLPVQLSGYSNNSASAGGASNHICQTCFCMGGLVHCQPLECDQPIDGCLPIKEDGHCCPDRYDCSKPQTQSLMISTTENSATSASSTSVFSETPATTTSSELSSNEMEGEIVTSTSEVTTTQASESLHVTVENNDDELKLDQTTKMANDDSFERIATVMTGSSEETSSMLPPQIIAKRVSATTIGGFKNRSDLGSREERRSKDGDELSLRQSTEDDEREDFMYPVFETTISNAIEDLGATTLYDVLSHNPTTDAEIESFETDTTPVETWRLENVTANYVGENEETTFSAQHDDLMLSHDELNTNIVETTSTPVTSSVEPDVVSTTTFPTVEPSLDNSDSTTLPPPVITSSTELVAETVTISSSTDSPTSTSSSEPTTIIPSSSTTTFLEFIPFVEEDALNDTSGVINALKEDAPHDSTVHGFIPESVISILKPLELKFMNGTEETLIPEGSRESDHALEDALPIIVEKDITESFHPIPNAPYNTSATLPISTSLYSNGFYPHGNIIKDDGGPPGELLVSEGELSPKKPETVEDDEEETPENAVFNVKFSFDSDENESSELNLPLTSSSPASPHLLDANKRTEQPLETISSIDKFIPSYTPSTAQPVIDAVITPDNNPSRTYSKFGMQDSPFYRFDYQGQPSVPLDSSGFIRLPNPPPQQYHHRYYNEPEEIPQSRIQNQYNYYTHTGADSADKQVPISQGQPQSMGMLPPIYKNTDFIYEDSSTGLESYEEYDTFVNPPSSNGLSSSTLPPSKYSSTSTPRSTTSTYSQPGASMQFLGERVRLPSYNQQRATSTPKYKYAHKSTYQKKFNTERTTTPRSKYVPFPFSYTHPKNPDNGILNLGIKLSGCNVVGKMYRVGEFIEELSGECVRCMCSDIGVHCAELEGKCVPPSQF